MGNRGLLLLSISSSSALPVEGKHSKEKGSVVAGEGAAMKVTWLLGVGRRNRNVGWEWVDRKWLWKMILRIKCKS